MADPSVLTSHRNDLSARDVALYGVLGILFGSFLTGGFAFYDPHPWIGGILAVVGGFGLIVMTVLLIWYRLRVIHALVVTIAALLATWVVLGYVISTKPKEVIVHDPPTADDLAKAKAPIKAELSAEKQRAATAINDLDKAHQDIANDVAAIGDLTHQRDFMQSQLQEIAQQKERLAQQKQRLAQLKQSRDDEIKQAMSHINSAKDTWVNCKLPPPPGWVTYMCHEQEFMVGTDALARISNTLYPNLKIDFSTNPDAKYNELHAPEEDKLEQNDPRRIEYRDRYFVVQKILDNYATLVKTIEDEIRTIETKIREIETKMTATP